MTPLSPPTLGNLLRYWRGQRGKSQLDLSVESGVTQRHISFLESGRSNPSRRMLLLLSRALDIPLRARNELLLAAGYAPLYPEPAWDSAEMAFVSQAIDRVLAQQEPYPALVLDRQWNVLRTNAAAPRFFGGFIDLSRFPRPRNLLRLLFDPAGFRPHIENWEELAAGLLERVRREALGHVLDVPLQQLLQELAAFPGVRQLQPPVRGGSPVIPITFLRDGERSSWFSLVSTVGAPQSVAAEEIRIECLFPADSA